VKITPFFSDHIMDNRAAVQLFKVIADELRSENPTPALRSVSIINESGHYVVRVLLKTTVFGWEKSKQAILEKYGQGIDIVLVHR
jgi:hypothetical protein